ncbi:acetolactate decarboxylase [Aquimarina sp. ERC-38]|uniref:acetolactate decarboxylase n=1 Tax=Aquimarina sp. ERC-38 TaxID=2949996 RepID=UPI002246184F|nr:acetolactate decarboxylase [Aquimarina sp. ERC-38]UZO79616.1 acetolactate decarboxylase [Aquimarina sp. ERC-38]
MIKYIIIGFLVFGIFGCNSNLKKDNSNHTYHDIQIVGAMKNVMWKGELQGTINLDTISNRTGLYGLGPESYLTGEILINNGQSYVSRVTSDSTMTVKKTFDVSAPFLVYTHVTEWNEIALTSNIKTIQDIENFVDEKTVNSKRPFAFKLIGKISEATIHIQNLPEGTKVSSPKEAHQGQTDYQLKNEEVTIIGFFSTEHKGIFTHHDSNIHLHLITKDESKMGHVDEVNIEEMKLFLPVK